MFTRTRKKGKTPNKNYPFIDNIRLLDTVNYSEIKDFPIWWSGYFVNDYDDRDSVYDINGKIITRGDLLRQQMIKASRILKGYTSMDAHTTVSPRAFDKDNFYDFDFKEEPIDKSVVVTDENSGSGIIYTPSPQSTPRLSTQRSPTPRASTPRAPTPRASTPRSPTPRSPTQRSSTQRASTQRASTQRASTPGSSMQRATTQGSYTQRATTQQASPLSTSSSSSQSTPRNPYEELKKQNLPLKELIQAVKNIQKKRDKNYSEQFTLLALQSDPTDIGLFVNCSLDEFVDKIFYKIEFDIIVNYYKGINKPFTLHIFNITNDNCLNLQKKIMLINNKLIKKQLNQSQLAAELTKSIKHINCYDLLELVQITSKKLRGVYNGPIDPNELTISKITSMDVRLHNESVKTFISQIITPITDKLKDKACHIKSKKEFIRQINEIYTLLGMPNPKIVVKQAHFDDNDWFQKRLTLIDLLTKLQIYIYNYFIETDYTCFVIYKNIKELIDDITNNPAIEMPIIQSQLKQINMSLQQENNKHCIGIREKLLKKLKTDKVGKALITFNCLTCANLIDCAKIIRNHIVNPKVILR
jgi:hypothetical protein